jgi:hypothetical protein
MRVLGKDVINEMTIQDSFTGTEIAVYYRTPTTQERQAWLASLFSREGGEVKDEQTKANLEWGKTVLTGIGENCFGVPEGENGVKPISSNSESENYRADWRELLCEFAPDFVEFLAERVFRGHRQIFKSQPGREPYDSKN